MSQLLDRNAGVNTRRPGWHRVVDPPTGYAASKTTGWTADSFSGGLTVDFSAVSGWTLPAAAKAVVCACVFDGGTVGAFFARPGSDADIANTPNASSEWAAMIGTLVATAQGTRHQVVLWLAADGTVDFAVQNTDLDLYISYPVGWIE